MATVTAFTAERSAAIESQAIVGGAVVGDDLILTRFDDSTINAGVVRGATGSPGVTEAEFDAAIAAAALGALPVGSIIDYVGIVAPTNYLTMIGQTVVNGQTIHAALWAVLPASMKSGANIVMPDTRKAVSAGYDASDTDFNAIGKTGGAKTQVLTQDQLPEVALSINPPSLDIIVNPPNASVSVTDPGHLQLDLAAGTMYWNIADGNGTSRQFNYVNKQTGISATVDIAPLTIPVDIPAFPSSNLGNGAPHSLVQPYVTFLKIIKVV